MCFFSSWAEQTPRRFITFVLAQDIFTACVEIVILLATLGRFKSLSYLRWLGFFLSISICIYSVLTLGLLNLYYRRTLVEPKIKRFAQIRMYSMFNSQVLQDRHPRVGSQCGFTALLLSASC